MTNLKKEWKTEKKKEKDMTPGIYEYINLVKDDLSKAGPLRLISFRRHLPCCAPKGAEPNSCDEDVDGVPNDVADALAVPGNACGDDLAIPPAQSNPELDEVLGGAALLPPPPQSITPDALLPPPPPPLQLTLAVSWGGVLSSEANAAYLSPPDEPTDPAAPPDGGLALAMESPCKPCTVGLRGAEETTGTGADWGANADSNAPKLLVEGTDPAAG